MSPMRPPGSETILIIILLGVGILLGMALKGWLG